MKTGIIEIQFKEGLPDEVLRGMVSKFYKENEDKIQFMEFSQLNTEEDLRECHNAIRLVMQDLPKNDAVHSGSNFMEGAA